MKKRFLGIICLLYSGIILYVWLSNELKNFLAPNMQIYLKLSLIPLTLIGLVMLFNNKVHYRFKISDLILLLPLIILIFANDGRLTASLAANRMTNVNRKASFQEVEINETIESSNEIDENIQEIDDSTTLVEQQEIKEEETKEFIPYFDVIDETYNELANYISYTQSASKYQGFKIRVRGMLVKNISYAPDDYFMIGKYSISCCAADAEFIGFFIKNANFDVKNNSWYEVEGTLEKGKDKNGYDIMYIVVSNLKEINSKKEEQYIYPCFNYGDGSCKKILEYDLEY